MMKYLSKKTSSTTRDNFCFSNLQNNWRVDLVGKNKGENPREGSAGQSDLENGTFKISVGLEVNFTVWNIFKEQKC